MNLRKITSLTALVSFIFLMLTSIVLYIVPAGRVAYWADWRLWSLNKENWGAVHTNLGFLLLISLLLHGYYNWTPLVNYIKNRSKQFRLVSPHFNISLLITLGVFFGTLAGLPPFSSILNLSASIKDKANKFYGEPPYGHAELSPLDVFADRLKINLDEGILRLEKAGISIADRKQTLLQIAKTNQMPPNQVYQAMKPTDSPTRDEMPEEAPGGTGHQTLAQLCQQFGLDSDRMIQELERKQLRVDMEKTIKDNATANNLGPHEMYAEIRKIARNEP